jgi:hypothetical protein
MLDQLDMFGGPPPVVAAKPCRVAFRAAAAMVAAMRRGEAVTYHVGDLAGDRLGDAAVAGRAAAYLEAADAGRVLLSQRRIGPGRYEYRAVRR